METKAPAGLEQTIAAHRPILFAKLDTRNDETFLRLAAATHHAIARQSRR
jgi:hypothetical protein